MALFGERRSGEETGQAANECAKKQRGRGEEREHVAIDVAQARSQGAAVALESQHHPREQKRQGKLNERAPPSAQAIRDIGIIAALPEAAHPQDGKSEKDEGKITHINSEGRDGEGEAKECLHRIRQDRDGKKETKFTIASNMSATNRWRKIR